MADSNTTVLSTITTKRVYLGVCDKARAELPIRLEYKISVYLYIFFYGPATISGVVLNVTTILVLKKMNKDIYYLLKVLAIFDICYSSSVFVMYPLRAIHLYVHLGDTVLRIDDWFFGWEFTQVALGPFYIFQLIRNWCVILISLERLVITLFPLKSRVFWTRKVVNCVIFLLTVFSFLCFIPSFILDRALVPQRCIHYSPTLGQGRFFPFFHRIFGHWKARLEGWQGTLINIIAPMIALFAVNVVLIVALIVNKFSGIGKSRSAAIKNQTSNTLELRALRMSFALVAVFVGCESLLFIGRMQRAGFAIPDTPIADLNVYESRMVQRKIAIGLTVVDSCMNFLVYCLSNSKFRLAVVELTTQKCKPGRA
ncbi:uncharacterized protein LOC141910477 [Tubulanus polymorphus]|uniref:uncharacterized protein LOC141910477 n=1 Tax=Tubulanus polymorphus TaxID=672921 RepID=UPI003DA2F1D7